MLECLEAWLQQFIIATTRRNLFRDETSCYQNVWRWGGGGGMGGLGVEIATEAKQPGVGGGGGEWK